MNASEQYFLVVLFVMLYEAVVTHNCRLNLEF